MILSLCQAIKNPLRHAIDSIAGYRTAYPLLKGEFDQIAARWECFAFSHFQRHGVIDSRVYERVSNVINWAVRFNIPDDCPATLTFNCRTCSGSSARMKLVVIVNRIQFV